MKSGLPCLYWVNYAAIVHGLPGAKGDGFQQDSRRFATREMGHVGPDADLGRPIQCRQHL